MFQFYVAYQKKNFGEFRLIHLLSFPKGSSVNDGTPLEHSQVCYATIGDAINHIKPVGTGAYLANALFTPTKPGLIKQSFVKHDFAKLV